MNVFCETAGHAEICENIAAENWVRNLYIIEIALSPERKTAGSPKMRFRETPSHEGNIRYQ